MSYQDVGQALQTTDGNVTYANGPLGVSKWSNGTVTQYIVRDPSGDPIGLIQGSDHYYFMTDKNGSITTVIYQDGGLNPSAQYEYDAWGNITNSYAYGVTNPLGFDGGIIDPPGGLVKFGNRFYDTTTGRWTQQDPVGGAITNPTSINAFVFAGDNPVNLVDTSGLSWWTRVAGIG